MGEQENNNKMTLVDHLQELRRRLVWVIIFFIITLVVGFFFADSLLEYFKNSSAAENIEWNVFKLSDGVMVYLKFAFLIAVAFTLPFALFQVWWFVAPGLTKNEKKLTLWFVPSAFLLFIIGISFAYFITFPMIVNFLSNISTQIGVQEMYGLNEYFTFMFNMIIPFGILFELPVIVVFLTRIGFLKSRLLIRFRKIAYLLLIIVAASITPPDLVSEILVSLPLLLLYEFSIWLSKLAELRRKKAIENDLEEDKKNKVSE